MIRGLKHLSYEERREERLRVGTVQPGEEKKERREEKAAERPSSSLSVPEGGL